MGIPANIVVLEHTVQALRSIQSYRYLTKDQVAAVTGMRPKSASEMLLRLERQKLLASFGNVPIAGRGKTPKVYYLKRRGYRVLADAVDDELPAFKEVNVTSRWSPKMAHRMATIDVMMAVERGVEALPGYRLVKTLLEYRRDNIGSRWVIETSDYVVSPETPDNRIIPDAGFVLENEVSGRRGLFLIEVDLGTKSHTSMSQARTNGTVARQIEQYDRYLTGGRFKHRYEQFGFFEWFWPLFITNSDERVENMRRLCSGADPRFNRHYRFSTLQRVKQKFFHSDWKIRDPEDHEGYELVRGAGT